MIVPNAIRGASSRSAFSQFWSKAKEVPAKYPFMFGFVVSGTKTSVVDLLVQKVVEKKEKIDWKTYLKVLEGTLKPRVAAFKAGLTKQGA